MSSLGHMLRSLVVLRFPGQTSLVALVETTEDVYSSRIFIDATTEYM